MSFNSNFDPVTLEGDLKENSSWSRRDILAGVALTALGTLVPTAIGSPLKLSPSRLDGLIPTAGSSALQRYMASSVLMADGRVLVTGGYNRSPSDLLPVMALSSVVVIVPGSGTCLEAAPMGLSRARHASVALHDGRVIVIGGISQDATASTEIYDPRTNSWSFGPSLPMPIYDHSAVAYGSDLIVIGGSSSFGMTSLHSISLEYPSTGSLP